MIIYYRAEIGWKIDWQENWNLPQADPVFLDNTLPQRGLNHKASNYSNKNDYDVHVAFDLEVSKDGVSTNYRALSAAGSVNDYDEPSVNARDFTCDIKLFTLAGYEITGIIPDQIIVMKAIYTLVNGGDIADYADVLGIHRLETYQNTSYQIFEYSSQMANLTNIPLLSDSGFLEIDFDGDVITTTCQIDGSKLNPGTKYKVSSRLKTPQENTFAPIAEITNINPDVETGLTSFQLLLTPGSTPFIEADTCILEVYNDSTDELLFTISGNWFDDINNYSGTFAAYLSGVVDNLSTIQFNKLQWAIDEGLTNADAIALRFEFVITQSVSGLSSNIAIGVFDVELQPAEYVGDLRYFSTDDRKLYLTGVDGVNQKTVGLDITSGYSNLTPQTANQIHSLTPLNNATIGSPWSTLIGSDDDGTTTGNINIYDTLDGINWTISETLKTFALSGRSVNRIIKDDIRTHSGENIYWVGFDLKNTDMLMMLYYDGAAWQFIDFGNSIEALTYFGVILRISPNISFNGGLHGYSCDNGNGGYKYVWRMVQTSGSTTTFSDFSNPANWTLKVMTGGFNGSVDGSGLTARFKNPYQFVMTDDDGTHPTEIYLTDGNNYAVRKLVYNSGTDLYDVTTPIGLLNTSGNTDAIGSLARFGDIRGLAVSANNLYIGDFQNNTIRKVDLITLQVSTFSGNGVNAFRLATLY